MRLLAFSKRTLLEILRDPLTLFFGILFPSILILLLTAIQKNIPVSLFEINSLAPAITIFGLSFMTLFSASLISKDKESELLTRLYASPLTAIDFILGYTLPIIVIAVCQSIVCFILGIILGLNVTINIIYCILFIIPISIIFISLGLLFGSILNSKQVGGICGALLTNVTAWLSGIWFDLNLAGGWFKSVASVLPFYHAVELEKLVYLGLFNEIFIHLIWILGYAIIITILAVILFLKQMKKD